MLLTVVIKRKRVLLMMPPWIIQKAILISSMAWVDTTITTKKARVRRGALKNRSGWVDGGVRNDRTFRRGRG